MSGRRLAAKMNLALGDFARSSSFALASSAVRRPLNSNSSGAFCNSP